MMMNVITRCAQLLGVNAAPTHTSLTACSYKEIEPSIRTGDILFYNDDSSGLASEQTRRLRNCAAWLTRCMLTLPCLSSVSVMSDDRQQSRDQDEDNNDQQRYATPRASQRPLLPVEWLDWQHAALIVCLSDKGDEQPYVFRAIGGRFVLTRLDEVVGLQHQRFFAIRHLIINKEAGFGGVDVIARRRYVSQRRSQLRDRICEFHRSIYQAEAARQPAPLHMHITSVLNEIYRPAGANSPPPVECDQHTLMLASTSFTTLYTLYKAQILRVEPRVADANQLLQDRNSLALHSHMTSDFHFTDEQLFLVKK